MKSSCTSISCRFLWAKFSTMISAANSAKSTFPVKPSSKKHIIFLCWAEECFSTFFKEIHPLSAQWGIFRTISKTKKKTPAISKSRKKKSGIVQSKVFFPPIPLPGTQKYKICTACVRFCSRSFLFFNSKWPSLLVIFFVQLGVLCT